MSAFHHQPNHHTDPSLAQAIEPLAGYICAADRPREVLRAALTALLEEVQATNRTAFLQVATRHANSLGLAL